MDAIWQTLFAGDPVSLTGGYGIDDFQGFVATILLVGVTITLLYLGFRHIRKAGRKL